MTQPHTPGTCRTPSGVSRWTEAELTEAFVYIAVYLYNNYLDHYARLDLPNAPFLSA